MEIVPLHPNDGTVDRTNDLMAIVLCEDAAAAPRACALLDRVGRKSGAPGRLIYSWWTFGALASASLRHLSTSQASAADMAIIAAREGPGLPEAVKDWISLWLATGEYHPRSRALVALLEPDTQQSAASRGVLRDLKHLAEEDAVDFIANGDELSRGTALMERAAPAPGNSSWPARWRGGRRAGRTGKEPDAQDRYQWQGLLGI